MTTANWTPTPSAPVTAQSSITEQLRRAITGGQVAAGTKLVQSELAAMLSVSITPVREALRELIAEGLVDFDAFKSAVVHTPTQAELDEVHEIRARLIPMSIERGTANITEQELTQAKALAAVMEATEDRSTWTALNREFHQILDGAAGAPRLAAILDRMLALSMLYVNLAVPPLPFEHNADHRKLLAAYEAGDVAAATKVALDHLDASLDAARAAIEA